MNGWRHQNLGDVCEVLDSLRRPITKRDRIAGPFPYYGATGIVDHVADFIFDEKLVLVGEDGAKWGSGEHTAFVVDGKYWVNNHAHVLRPKRDKLLDEWLAYYLTHLDLAPWVGGLTVPKLNQGSLREIPIPLPPLAEQKRIVAILDEAFEGIAKAAANAERNLANARELPDALLDATLGARDGAWVEATLGEIAEFKNGLNFTKASKGETIRIVGVKDFRNEYWVPSEGLDTVTIDGRLATSYELRTDDILTVRSNGNKKLIGRCMIAAEVPEKTSHSGFTIRIRISDDRVSPQFLAHVLKSRSARAELVASGGGANISSLNQQALAALPVAFPSRADQERILTHIESLMGTATQLAEVCRLKLVSLVELKQALLHKVFSGQLTGKEEVAA